MHTLMYKLKQKYAAQQGLITENGPEKSYLENTVHK
jgi:hypothetical protein